MSFTSVKLLDHSANLSDKDSEPNMDDFINDMEIGVPYNPPRHSNKRMKKRKQLDALLKFRPRILRSSRMSNENLLSSEDESLLTNQKVTSTKIHSTRYRRWCSYTRHILSFCLVCIFMIVCVGLAYANIELKTEVQNLSYRVTEIENRFSTFETDRILSTIESLKHRLNLIERWNVSFIYDRLNKLQGEFRRLKENSPLTEGRLDGDSDNMDLTTKLNTIEQKSTQIAELADEFDKLSQDADDETRNMLDDRTRSYNRKLIEHLLNQDRRTQDSSPLSKILESLNQSLSTNVAKWNDELKTLRNELDNLNRSLNVQELAKHLQDLTALFHNSSDNVSVTLLSLQQDVDKLRKQMDACQCAKERLPLKPSVVDSGQLQQSMITKPNVVDSASSPLTTISTTSTQNPNPTTKLDHNNTIDIAQIVNQPSSATN